MLRTKPLLVIFFLVLSFAWLQSSGILKRAGITHTSSTAPMKSSVVFQRLQAKASQALTYAKQHRFNDDVCFMVDMSLPSGQNRFFVYDFNKDTISDAGLVTHGRCNEQWLEGRRYGNTVGCGCTSLGKYKIGNQYNGRFGLAFKLHGLETTNDKAFARFVVLHGHDCVPATETGSDICQSDGCPTVSPAFLQQLKPVINSSKKPVLLWIFEN